ncbi:hypothetical protein [Cellulomonas xiejunii]|uniref:Uncharacterized protein n=1 Tax=Cellulomonas xiejunii TaxID=2968083 RepID=A0ABY5KLA1_9CELL|nr:hypothetical protein [Cellulomonas xiejunii]MCC2320798.1 hypothetical protein [Cellulomonas xiejunii]UUI71084.1 hypothetical protein NP048_14980 [Cellulomonas xiejunii]
MATMQVAFELESQHGCLVVRDTHSDGDISEWDPGASASYVDRGSAIFAVIHGIEGAVRCELWRGLPAEPLPHTILTELFTIDGALQVQDPAGVVDVVVATLRGRREITVLGDDPTSPSRVQVVVGPDVGA